MSGWKIFGISLSVIVGIILLTFIGTCTGVCNSALQDAGKTVNAQYNPSVLLAKYEWFKNASASLDAKVADLKLYTSRFDAMKQAYGADSTNRKSWSRDDKQQWNIWQSECGGIAASYNSLAAEYNAQMVKFNYRFCNVGDLPAGATEPLPREYKPYIYNF